jgi:hypothetical protein
MIEQELARIQGRTLSKPDDKFLDAIPKIKIPLDRVIKQSSKQYYGISIYPIDEK